MNRNYEAISYFAGKLEDGSYEYLDGIIYNRVRGTAVKGTKRGKGGYHSLDSTFKGKRYRAHIHLVVFAYFHGMDELKKHETIDHVNGSKHDNRIENLQGCSVLENNKRWYDRYYSQV